MKLHRLFADTLGMACPIIQAPMAGGATSPQLVAAVANAGGLGSFAAAMLGPDAIRNGMAQVRALTGRAFAVNLFVLEQPSPDEQEVRAAMTWLEPLYRELGLPQTLPAKWCEHFPDQLEAVLAANPAAVSFTFGIVDADTVQRCHRAGAQVIGTATTVAEAIAWSEAGADAVCVQGGEAGGHRGTFLAHFDQAMIGTMALVPQVADAISLPVIAAGGVMDGRGVAASLVLGASAVQLGTAFLSCPEAPIHAGWKRLLLEAKDDATRVTRLFSGRPARGLANAFMDSMRPLEQQVPSYPIQNALTAPLRSAAATQDRPDYMSLWAGQGAGMSRHCAAAELVQLLMQECRQVLAGATGTYL